MPRSIIKRTQWTRQDYQNLAAGGAPTKRKKKSQKRQKGGGHLVKRFPVLVNMAPKFNKNTNQRRDLINSLTNSDKKCVQGICRDFLAGKLSTDAHTVQQLRANKGTIYKLADKKCSLDEIKRLLNNQKGGNVLGKLLPLAIHLLPELIGGFAGLFKKKK